jgi:hypothetical protein
MAGLMMVGGFLLAIGGIAAWSKAAACLVAGLVPFVAGGMEHRRTRATQSTNDTAR